MLKKENINYLSWGIQTTVLILVCAFIGQWLDNKLENSRAYFTAALTSLAVIYTVYKLIKNS